MKGKALLKIAKESDLLPDGPQQQESDSAKSKADYKGQVRKLKGLFPKRKNKHGHESSKRKDPDEQPNPEIRQKSRKSKHHRKKKPIEEDAEKVRTKPKHDTASEPLLEALPPATTEKRRSNRSPNLIGLKFQAISTLLTVQVVLSMAGLILVPVIELIGSKYSWNRLAPAAMAAMVLLGLSSSAGLVGPAYIIVFRLEEVKGRALRDYKPLVLLGASAALALISLVIAVFQYHDVMDIFGERFLHLLRSYRSRQKEKMSMDRIQMDFRCCGHYSYEDWAEVEVESLQEYGEGYVPFSCCSVHALSPCVHESVPRIESLMTEDEDPIVLKDRLSIYYIGCKYPMEKYYKTMLDWVIIISALLMVTQFLLLLILFLVRKASNKENHTVPFF